MASFQATRKHLADILKWHPTTVTKRLQQMGITHSGALSHGEVCKFLSVHYPEKVPAEYRQLKLNL